MSIKKSVKDQKYEKYWKITLEYSDIYGNQFNRVLKEIILFIDNNPQIKKIGITSEQYKELQNKIEIIYPKNDCASTRKSINQFLKLGFVNNRCMGYHNDTKKFLRTKNKEDKKAIYSKILYENASFDRSITNFQNKNEINFLIKTIESCTTINKQELLAIMFLDIDKIERKYLVPDELETAVKEIILKNVESRKYNQRNYLFKICSSLSGVYVKNGVLSLNPIIDDEKVKKVRDPYLQRIYKIRLIEECKDIYNKEKGICMLEKLSYPVLIASHIKPYKDCDVDEEFDINNGLLLSKNLDSLFDLGYISFDDFGNILISSKLDTDVAKTIKNYKLDKIIYNSNRHKYMEYHRKYIFNK